MKRRIAAGLAVLFIIGGVAAALASGRVLAESPVKTTLEQQLGLGENTYVLAQASADVTGDGIADECYLIGYRPDAKSQFNSKIDLLVKDGATGAFTSADLPRLSGYGPQMVTADFNGDGVADVFITAASGGSGGIVENIILSMVGGKPDILFAHPQNRGVEIDGKFIDGFRVELTVGGAGQQTVMDVSRNKADYIRLGIYDNNGTLLKERKPWIDPFSKLEAVDVDGDGVYELRGVQKIAGAYHADGIARVESVWKYTDGAWGIKQLNLVIPIQPVTP